MDYKVIFLGIVLVAVFVGLVAYKILKKKQVSRSRFTDEEYEEYEELKMKGLEYVLGKSDRLVGHAIIPFEVGGSVDMYYFPNGVEGTGFATMELINPDGLGPVKNSMGTYELVAFTRHKYSSEDKAFSNIERRMCKIFTELGFYTKEVRVEPRETCEVPQDEGEPNICLIFDEYTPGGKQFKIGDNKHGLLLVIEVFPDEMHYAMDNGGQNLLDLLKEKGYYPYSDMDRTSVIG